MEVIFETQEPRGLGGRGIDKGGSPSAEVEGGTPGRITKGKNLRDAIVRLTPYQGHGIGGEDADPIGKNGNLYREGRLLTGASAAYPTLGGRGRDGDLSVIEGSDPAMAQSLRDTGLVTFGDGKNGGGEGSDRWDSAGLELPE